MYPVSNKGFSLFELVIVIVVITTMFLLIVPFFPKKPSLHFEFSNLKAYLSSLNPKGDIELICVDECKECYLVYDGKKEKTNLIQPPLEAYHYLRGELELMTFLPSQHFKKSEKICFRYRVQSPKELGDELFVRYQERIYYFTPYFMPPKEFTSLVEAKEFYEKQFETLKEKR